MPRFLVMAGSTEWKNRRASHHPPQQLRVRVRDTNSVSPVALGVEDACEEPPRPTPGGPFRPLDEVLDPSHRATPGDADHLDLSALAGSSGKLPVIGGDPELLQVGG